MTAYQDRVNTERLARQAPDVKRLAKEILDQLKTMEQQVYWALDDDAPAYWPTSLIEHAHLLIDIGHDYRAALKANPPPLEDNDAA